MHSLFRDKVSQSLSVVSEYSVDFPDYESLTESGHMEKITEGTKKECLAMLDEIESEILV